MRKNIGMFRGKCADIGEWIRGGYTYIGDCALIWQNEDDRGTNPYRVDPDTVGEYTGLFDRNGKRIFEGDLLRTKKYGVCIGQSNVNGYDTFFVVYRPGGFRLERDNPDRGFNLTDSTDLEIVGNIYDNPELIGGTKNAP